MFSDKIKRYKAHKSAASNRKHKLTGARTYFYENEASCEKNMETFLRCIEAVSGTNNSYKKVERAQRLINLEIPVLVRSLKSSNVELG